MKTYACLAVLLAGASPALAQTEPAVVAAARAALPLVDLTAVLRHLLREQVSIVDMARILTVLADQARFSQDPKFLAERVRPELIKID